MLHALIFSEDAETIVRLSDVFRESGFAVQAVGTLKEARTALLHDMPDVALVDYDVLGPLISAWDKFLDGHKAGVEIYDEDPNKPFDYFTIRYLNKKFEIVSRGKSEHDTEWKVSREYLQSIVDDPQKYIDNPTKLDLDWLKHRLPDAASPAAARAAAIALRSARGADCAKP